MDDERTLEAAARVWTRRPAATMDDVAAEARISRATLFRRFPSRGALVAELSRVAVTRYVAAVEGARPEEGPAPEALRRVLRALAALAPAYGWLATQPLTGEQEAQLSAQARGAEERLKALVRRGQTAGDFRVDLPAEWAVLAMTWLTAGAADGLRLGAVAPRDLERLLAETVLGALRRVDGSDR